jgi:polyisoprenyl-phosphate glycosyltransferase
MTYYSYPIISVVIPVYKEGEYLYTAFETIKKELDKTNEPYEMWLVDDGSPDNTWSVIQDIAEKFDELRAIRLSRNFGKEYALCAGLESAQGKAIIIMDGDLQHPPELIPEMVRAWRQMNIDIVEAVKVSRGKESFLTKFGSNFFYTCVNQLSGYNLKGASDYKLLDRKVVDSWLQMGERSLFFRGMVAWLGFRCLQIPFTVPERIGGRSKWSVIRLIRLALTGITAFSSMPLHFVTILGSIFLVFAFALGAQALFLKLTGQAVSGFTTVILLILMVGSLLMISLGIIGEYLARIYEEVKSRPRYVVLEKISKP